ncbi:MAG: mechanosensitive ion channel family protein, partial [Acidobacteriota bacterium]|nr:mechanosensitive ion channel family protein [Acidobacteriota bacterium]
MQQFISDITSLLDNDIVINNVVISAQLIRFAILAVVAIIVHAVAILVVLPLIESFVKKTRTDIDNALINRKLFKRAFHLLPATVISIGLPTIFDGDSEAFVLISRALSLYYILIGLATFDAFLSAVRDIYEMRAESRKVGITGAIQALKVIGLIIAIILAISVLAGRSPVYFISGLGAFTAILMLIFKDPILGLVAGVQLSAMDLVRKGDWLDIPKHGADGSVVDISLTTVTVRNWDMTFTAIPAYELVASSFKNW